MSLVDIMASGRTTLTPSLVIAQVPAEFEPGTYQLVLRSYQGGKELHESRCPAPFLVAAS